MQELTIVFSDNDRMRLGDELSRLFALQDMPLGKEKKAIIVDELSIQGISIDALVAGLRSMSKADLKTIKLSTIIEAGWQKTEPRESTGTQCGECHDGMVIMRDEKHREFLLGCICGRGEQRSQSLSISRWNGEPIQERRGRTLWLIPKIESSQGDDHVLPE